MSDPTKPTESDTTTPQTDAAYRLRLEPWAVARALECKLVEARRERDGWEEMIQPRTDTGKLLIKLTTERDALRAELEAVKKERDALRSWKAEQMTVESGWDAQDIAKQLGAKLGQSIRKVIAKRVPEIIAATDACQRDRHRLREALEKLRDCDWVISLPDRMEAVRDIAREALFNQPATGLVSREVLEKCVGVLMTCSADYNDPRFTDRRQTGPLIKAVIKDARAELAKEAGK